MSTSRALLGILAGLLLSCATGPTMTVNAPDLEAVYAPLDVGADYASWKKVSKGTWESKTHGHRFVEIYVNDVGYDAYVHDQELPPGSIVVKTSKENAGGKPSDVDGPIFVMKKEAPGYFPEHNDWFYAFHWAKPTPAQAKALGGPVYWRGKSEKVRYCWKCHENYDRELGGVAEGHEAWK